eukprot:g19172.t1
MTPPEADSRWFGIAFFSRMMCTALSCLFICCRRCFVNVVPQPASPAGPDLPPQQPVFYSSIRLWSPGQCGKGAPLVCGLAWECRKWATQ